MAIKVRIGLLILAAVLLSVFSISASAKPQISDDQPLTIASAPLDSLGYRCAITNVSDTTLDVEIAVVDHMGDVVDTIYPLTATMDPGRIYFSGGTMSPHEWRRCTVSWVGQPGDLRASFCAWQDGLAVDIVCLDLW
jgi:hypothetical protein